MKKAVQQIMLGTVSTSEKQALDTLKKIKEAGYDGIELNGFMIQPTSLMVRMLTKAAGMPTGKGGKFDWQNLVKEANLEVVAIQQDLGSLERDIETKIAEAKSFDTSNIVITGMYRFDYQNLKDVEELCIRLNKIGELLKNEGINLLYHNHNVEFLKVRPGVSAYSFKIAKSNGVDTVILESHRNFAEKSPIKSIEISAKYLNTHF